MSSSRRNLLQVWLWSLVLVNVFALCIAQDYTFVVEEIGHRLLCNDVNTLIVNRSIPGPALNLTYGQTVTVNVINKAKRGITIHWHGVKQPRNSWSDGPVYVTQCHIQPGNNYTYTIILTEEEGTLWWHAHSEWSRATVYGAIYIRPSEGRVYPYPVQPDGQQGIVLGTWFEKDVQDFIDDFLVKGASFPVDYEALTINGLPGYFYGDIECTSGASDVGMFEMEVEFGKTYLLRVINAALNEDLVFGVAGHKLTVVGSDAAYLKPFVTDQISIGTGQTMDVLLFANQTPRYYYMEARHSEARKNQSTSGLLKYTNLTEITTTNTDLSFVGASTFQKKFRSLNNSNYTYDVPQTVDTNIFMTVSLNTLQDCGPDMGCNVTGYASLSNITFVNPNIDVLQAYYLNMSDVYTTDFPYKSPVFDYTNATGVSTYSEVNGTKVFVVDYNSTVELIFQGTSIKYSIDEMGHTMHLHGHSFYFVGWGSGNYNESSTADYNLVDPPLINTVAMGGVNGDAWVAIRFRANNPGVWFMHCHRARHLMGGMAAVMIVRNGPTKETSLLPPPHSLKGSCAAADHPQVSTTVAPSGWGWGWGWGSDFFSSMFN